MSKDYVMQLEATIQNLRRDNSILKEQNTKYKDLEEQLGCPLEVIIRALKDGIYNKRGFHYEVILYEDVLCAYPIDVYDESWELSNYKKTFWLKEDKSE